MNPFCALFLVFALFAGGQARAQDMSFKLSADRAVVFARGNITEDAPERFHDFIYGNRLTDQPITINLHSTGGSVQGGSRLGAMIRNFGFSTRVTRARCASACVYAFLGGVEPCGLLYVHRFYGPATSTSESIELRRAEFTQYILIRHTLAMGVSAELQELAYSVEPHRARYITLEERIKWNVVTPKLVRGPTAATKLIREPTLATTDPAPSECCGWLYE